MTPSSQASPSTAAARASAPNEQEISHSYIYLLGRLLVLRQQRLDFKEGFQWNQLVHRKPGEVTWPNPNLDVAYSEAWVAVDEKSYAMVTVPKISGRYYTVQFLNGWGETVANINERLYPQHPHGKFAVCLKGADIQLPAAAQRIDVPVKYMRVLAHEGIRGHPKGVAHDRRRHGEGRMGSPTDFGGLRPQLAGAHARQLRRHLGKHPRGSHLLQGVRGSGRKADAPQGNWLPTPKGLGYSLTFRFYRPKGTVAERTYFPPPLAKVLRTAR